MMREMMRDLEDVYGRASVMAAISGYLAEMAASAAPPAAWLALGAELKKPAATPPSKKPKTPRAPKKPLSTVEEVEEVVEVKPIPFSLEKEVEEKPIPFSLEEVEENPKKSPGRKANPPPPGMTPEEEAKWLELRAKKSAANKASREKRKGQTMLLPILEEVKQKNE